MLRFFTHACAMGFGCSVALFATSLADDANAPLVASRLLATLGSSVMYLILSAFEARER